MDYRKIIAAVRTEAELKAALSGQVQTIFLLAPNIYDLAKQARAVHQAGKELFIHLDLAEGIGKDALGIRFAKEQEADGIISTRSNIIKLARKEGLATVQRFFIMDSHSIHTTAETAHSTKADMIEIMPGTVVKVIERLKRELPMPIVAGGLIETEEEIQAALAAGAKGLSIGKKEFWGC
jgi:glycerol uptake operon antiterminator